MMLGFAIAMMELLKAHMLASYFAIALGTGLDIAAFSLVFLVSFALNRALSSGKMKMFFALLANVATGCLFAILFVDPGRVVWTASLLAAFYLRAWWLARSALDHEFCVNRFDEGLLIFLIALGIAALVKLENPFAGQAALPYLAFSMLALGTAQGRKASGGKVFSKSHNVTIVSSTIILGLAAIGVAGIVPLTFLPAKKAGAFVGSVSLRILELIGHILEWLFRSRKPISSLIAGTNNDGPVFAERTGDEIGTSSIFMWVILGIFAIGAVLLAAYCLGLLFRYLTSDTKPRNGAQRRWLKDIFSAMLLRFKAAAAKLASFLISAKTKIAQRRIKESDALRAYRRLLACGRMAGIQLQKTDTPREYASKLSAFLPERSPVCSAVISAVEKQTYGKIQRASDPTLRAMAERMKPMDYLVARVGRLRNKPTAT